MANEIKCTIVSGAPADNCEYLKNNIDLGSYIICADSGYVHLLDAGITPDLIIGDFDSSQKPSLDCKIITLPAEKANTDTFECVQYAVGNGYSEIEIFNAIGSRVDHTYSNILCLDYCRRNGVKCTIKNEHNRISLITDKITFKREYDNFSLFAYLEDCEGVSIKGAYYTAGFYGRQTLDIKRSDQFAQSNYICDDECEISLKKGTLLLIESND